MDLRNSLTVGRVAPPTANAEDISQPDQRRQAFIRFLSDFMEDGKQKYKDLLIDSLNRNHFWIRLELDDVKSWSMDMFHYVTTESTFTLRLLEEACCEVGKEFGAIDPGASVSVQVLLTWNSAGLVKMRDMDSTKISSLSCIPGIVTSVHPVQARIKTVYARCRSCGNSCSFPQAPNQPLKLPRLCQASIDNKGANAKCAPNPYVIIPSLCEYEDSQWIKMQEMPEDVPAGELPRTIRVAVERELIDIVQPGRVVKVVAIQNLSGARAMDKNIAGLRKPFYRGVGIETESKWDGGTKKSARRLWKEESRADYQTLSRRDDVVDYITSSINPGIFGRTEVKQAIACMLFGGNRKKLADNSNLRGDINVMLVGDPSAGKSQMLKFTHAVAPLSIYTSGRGSSAAGLTAAIQRDNRGDFYLEGGAFVLADGGVVCIDEFDKMSNDDRTAIHEAMEQQTISISKAGLNTVLNSRVAVLAAANPRKGSLDSSLSNEEQLAFQESLLSRFDLIFKIEDKAIANDDRRIAEHVLNNHKHQRSSNEITDRPDHRLGLEQGNQKGHTFGESIDPEFLRAYIQFCRDTCTPTISEEARTVLIDSYVTFRDVGRKHRREEELGMQQAREKERKKREEERAQQQMQANQAEGGEGGSNSNNNTSTNANDKKDESKKRSNKGQGTIRVTVRHLESLIRLTEALARMRLSDHANKRDAERAIELFRFATLDAIASDRAYSGETEVKEVVAIESEIRKMINLGDTARKDSVISHLRHKRYSDGNIYEALKLLIGRDELEEVNQTKLRRK